MKNESLSNIIDEYFEKIPPPYVAFNFGKSIPQRKLKNACKFFAPYDQKTERPLLLIDDTLFCSAKIGLLLTNTTLYYRLKNRYGGLLEVGNISLCDIAELHIETFNKGSYLLVNKNNVAYIRAFGIHDFKQREAQILNKLFELIISFVHPN